MKRLISALLCIAMILSLAMPAMAEVNAWTCSACSRQHNIGNFCPDCGAISPLLPHCTSCGYWTENVSARYCAKCGQPLTVDRAAAADISVPEATVPTVPTVPDPTEAVVPSEAPKSPAETDLPTAPVPDAAPSAEADIVLDTASGDIFENLSTMLAGMNNYRVTDAESALAIPNLTQLVDGLQDPAMELILADETHLDDSSIYRFAQYHEGLPVYGGEVIVSANADGEDWFVSSSFQKMDYFSWQTASAEAAVNSIREKYGDSCDILGMDDCIYVNSIYSGLNRGQCVKQVCISSPDFYGLVFTDGYIYAEAPLTAEYNTVNVLDANKHITKVADTADLYTYTDINADNPQFVQRVNFVTEDREPVYDMNTWLPVSENMDVEHLYFSQTLVSKDGGEILSMDMDDVRAQWYRNELASLEQFYTEAAGEDFLEKYDVVIASNALLQSASDNTKGDPNNAMALFPSVSPLLYYPTPNFPETRKLPPRVTYMISIGAGYEGYKGDRTEEDLKNLNNMRDILGHEFGHQVDNTVRFSSNYYIGESGAVMEAIADIWGELYEAYATGKCDWEHHTRSLTNPASAGLPTSYQDKSWYSGKNDSDFKHNNSTVISHMFCVMNDYGRSTGKEEGTFSTTELSKLLYRILQNLPANSSFATFANVYVYTVYEMYKDQPQKLMTAQNALWGAGLNRFARFCGVVGKVVDQAGNPLESVAVTLSDLEGNPVNKAKTDDTGRYGFPYIPEEFYTITAEASAAGGSHVQAYTEAWISGPLDHAEDIVLSCYLSSGTVIDSKTAEPIAKAKVTCGAAAIETSKAGYFRILTESPIQQFTVSKDQYLDWNSEHYEGNFVEMTILLEKEPECNVYGWIYDKETNEPIQGATAWIKKASNTIDETSTDDAGSFRLKCASGTYSLYVSAPGYAQPAPLTIEIAFTGTAQDFVYLENILLEKALVRDAYSPELQEFLKIPEVTLDTGTAKLLNEQMYNELFYLRQAQNYNVSYTWEVSGNVLSISARLWHDQWSQEIKSYALVMTEERSDGRVLTPRQALLETANYTEAEYFQILLEKAAEAFDKRKFEPTIDTDINMFGEASQSIWAEAREKTLSEGNLQNADIHLRDGSLFVRIQIYYPMLGSIYSTDYTIILYPKERMSSTANEYENQPAVQQEESPAEESTPWLDEVPYPAPIVVTLSKAISQEKKSGNWSYVVLDDGTAKITGCSDAAGAMTIPDQIDGYTVTHIGNSAFAETMISSVQIPNTVRIIDINAFNRCTELTEAVLPSELLYLGMYAFSGCSKLQSVELPGSLGAHIGESAFAQCTSLNSVKLKPGIVMIPAYLFSQCSGLKSIAIPNTVTEIKKGAFAGTSLRSIVIPGSVKTVEKDAFACETLTNVTFEPGIRRLEKAFYGAPITEFTVPEGVTYFGGVGFCRNLTTVHLPSSLRTLDSYAFSNCYRLQNINIPEGVTEIPEHCFSNCIRLTDITLPSTLTTIGERAFEKTSLHELVIPESVTDIRNSAFQDCNTVTFYATPGTYGDQWCSK